MDGQDAGQGSGPASARCSFRVRTAGGAAEETAEKLFFLFAGAGIPILRCEYPRTDLEAIFLELTEKEKE